MQMQHFLELAQRAKHILPADAVLAPYLASHVSGNASASFDITADNTRLNFAQNRNALAPPMSCKRTADPTQAIQINCRLRLMCRISGQAPCRTPRTDPGEN